MSSQASPFYKVDPSEKGERSVNSLVKSYAAVTRSNSLSVPYNRRNPSVQREPGAHRPFSQHRSSTHGRGRGQKNSANWSAPKGTASIPRQPSARGQQAGEKTSDGKNPAASAVGRKRTNQTPPRAGNTLPAKGSTRDSPVSKGAPCSQKSREAENGGDPRQEMDSPKGEAPSEAGVSSVTNAQSSSSSSTTPQTSSGKSTTSEGESSSSAEKPQASPTAPSGAGKQRSWVLRRNLYQSGAVNDPNWAALQKQAEEARARAAAAKKKAEQEALEASKEQSTKKSDKPQTNNHESQSESDEEDERDSTVKFEDVVTVYEDDIAGLHSTSFVASWTSGSSSDNDSDEDKDEESSAKSEHAAEETADSDGEMIVKC